MKLKKTVILVLFVATIVSAAGAANAECYGVLYRNVVTVDWWDGTRTSVITYTYAEYCTVTGGGTGGGGGGGGGGTGGKSFEPELAVARAARRVLAGEDAHAVYEDAIRRYPDISFATFENRVRIFGDTKRVDDFLGKDQAALTRARVLVDARQRVILRNIAAVLQRRADATQTPLAAVKDAFWRELLREADTQILDPTFSLPDWKGVL